MKGFVLAALVLVVAPARGQACKQEIQERIMEEVEKDSAKHDARAEKVTQRLVAAGKYTREQVAMKILKLVAEDPEISALQQQRSDLAMKLMDALMAATPCPELEAMAKEAKALNEEQWDLVVKALEKR